MPTIAAPPPAPNPTVEINAHLLTEQTSHGEGQEALRLFDMVEDALFHWTQRAEVLLSSGDESDNSLEYQHILPEATFKVRVRYVTAGNLTPRRVNLDD